MIDGQQMVTVGAGAGTAATRFDVKPITQPLHRTAVIQVGKDDGKHTQPIPMLIGQNPHRRHRTQTGKQPLIQPGFACRDALGAHLLFQLNRQSRAQGL